MKKLVLLLSSIILAYSCTKSSDVDKNQNAENSEISFNASMTTRATDTAFEEGDEISVTSYSTDGSVYSKNASYIFSNSIFTSTSPLTYIDGNQELSFRALYPYVEMTESKVINFEVKSDQSINSNYTLSDLMTGYSAVTSSLTPELTFDHLLSKIVINITSSDVEMVNVVTTLNAMAKVEYNISTLSSVTTGNSTAITMASNGVNSYKAILVPQTISSSSVLGTITVNNYNYEVRSSADFDILAGKEYVINATISKQNITFDNTIINNWENGEYIQINDGTLRLADFSSTNYPTDSNTWVIGDITATADDFSGLHDALKTLSTSGRSISLEFPFLQLIPAYAMSTDNLGAFVSISAPVATEIGIEALSGISSLSTISFPSVTTIGNSAFAGSGITDAYFPLATNVGDYVFSDCGSLITVEMPSITSIGERAFLGCSKLLDFNIPSTVTSIAGGAFSSCSSLNLTNNSSYFNLEDGILYNQDKTNIISSLCSVVSGDLYLPTVLSVNNHAFMDCDAITSLELPNATHIGFTSFMGCTSLTSVKLPVATIVEAQAFTYCQLISSIQLPLAKEIGFYSFSGCLALKSIEIPSVTFIGYGAFQGSENIESIVLATDEDVKLTTIEDGAFTFTDNVNTTLTIGSENSEYISGKTLTVGNYSASFKSISVINN